jgi:4-nitrophenyl phosphatase
MSLIPSHIKSLIIDMDGVLWKSDSPIGDLPAIFSRISGRGLKVAFATNNSTRTPEQYVERLTKFGIPCKTSQVVTSALASADLLAHTLPRGGNVFAIGGPGVMEALQQKGFSLLSSEEAEHALAVVVGIDVQINFDKMREATLLVRKGVPFIGTNPDRTFPTPRGEIPGAGAWISVITSATGIQPIFAGKPAPYLIELALERLGTSREETLVVGDRLETDIAGGQAAGCPCALLLSGVSTREQVRDWKPPVNILAEDLNDLVG